MKKQQHNPTMSIKCTFSNAVHKILEPNLEVKSRDRWRHREKYKFTDAQKIEMFDKILAIHSQTSDELTNYQFDRRAKKRVWKERAARGWQPKAKTPKQ